MDKDQDLFIKHCKDNLHNYQKHQSEARRIYREAYENEPIEYKKNNAGVTAGNLYMLSKLKEFGAENWRPEKSTGKPKQNNYRATGAPVNSGVKPMKPLPKGMKGIVL